MKFILPYSIISLFLATIGFAQETPKPQTNPRNTTIAPKEFNSFKDRLYLGGNFGAWFGQSTYINVSPIIGCKITKDFSVGVGGVYNYFSQTIGLKRYSSTIYGSSTFARYAILENIFAQIGWDRLSVPEFNSAIINNRVWVDNILVGGGYRQSLTERGSFVAMIFYNINQTPLSPYANPIIQIGFNVGL